ncbi:hypothetical protein [Mycolicibacter arupensis]|uniref:Uncharacterized protein n=1 Tax=Mycolicibacter arupensis TaxID=342002 RepID=A0A0F5MSQ0_9MYCO|nr:hypothetical protein [Mycolicibacter arupensis]KKB97833.1 hypothetical protein WR43_17420 [Mycolicibacter arupensis]MCV7277045.1 hypothetical protein [Mycolicibacter arupensis]OQZ91967.1 hypothetical protein BST15_19450 [Mycolicibacter arupensis]
MVIDHEGKADVHRYRSLVEIDGWLSASIIDDGRKTHLSVHRSAELDDDHGDYAPVRQVLESGNWVQTSYCLEDDEDTIGGVAVEVIYELAEADAA